nr:zinc ABC transporter substrate-binding protein [Paenibacillus sp. YPD9-1]
MRRFMVLYIMLFALISVLLAGCGQSSEKAAIVEGKVNVITSFYPLYDFARHVGGDNVNVINLVPAGLNRIIGLPKAEI